jgi:hypothetical protein
MEGQIRTTALTSAALFGNDASSATVTGLTGGRTR